MQLQPYLPLRSDEDMISSFFPLVHGPLQVPAVYCGRFEDGIVPLGINGTVILEVETVCDDEFPWPLPLETRKVGWM